MKRIVKSIKIKLKSNSGIALPMALSCILIVTILVLELSYTQQISKNIAYDDYNSLKSEYLAKSGLQMTFLKLKIQKKAKDLIKDNTAISSMIINLPIVYPFQQLLTVTGFAEDEDEYDEEADAETKKNGQFEGEFIATVKPETGINLNQLLDDTYITGVVSDSGEELYKTNLKSFRETVIKLFEGKLQESINADSDFYTRYRDTNFEELANNIIDWVDKNNESVSGGDEDHYYQNQKPPYKAKNGLLDSFEELHLIEGMKDDLYDILKDNFSIYSENNFTVSEIVKKPVWMKYLSSEDLTDENIEEIAEEFVKEDTEWNKTVEDFEKHVRETYNVDFNEEGKDATTPHVVLSMGEDIDRFNIKSIGRFKDNVFTIDVIVDRSGDANMVYLYYRTH